MEQKKMSMSKAMLKAQDKYLKANTIGVYFRVNKNTDPDVVEYLNTIDNKRAYFLKLIREDMAKKKTEQ